MVMLAALKGKAPLQHWLHSLILLVMASLVKGQNKDPLHIYTVYKAKLHSHNTAFANSLLLA